MKVTLHKSIMTSNRVSFTERARAGEPNAVMVVCSLSKPAWADMGRPETIEVDIKEKS